VPREPLGQDEGGLPERHTWRSWENPWENPWEDGGNIMTTIECGNIVRKKKVGVEYYNHYINLYNNYI
jgi:hypothetical protein